MLWPTSRSGSTKCAMRDSSAANPVPESHPLSLHARSPALGVLRHGSTTPVGGSSTVVQVRGGPFATGASMSLVGRASVIAILDTALADCMSGESRIVLIEGATGSGKSTLLDTVAERASAAGAVVLGAVASPPEQQVPLSVLGQLVNGAQAFTSPESAAGSPAPSRVGAMQSFCAELRALSAVSPVVLCVDDVQHADEESLRYLQYVARHARSAPVLMVVTATPHAEAQDPVFTTELMRQPHFRRIRLGLLSPAEVGAVLGGQHGAGRPRAELAADLHRISGGNPLLLRALLQELEEFQEQHGQQARHEQYEQHEQHERRQDDGAPAADAGAELPLSPAPGGPFAEAVATCLHRTGPTATGLARAVALLGELASTQRITRLLGVGSSSAQRGLAALEAAGILDGVRFRHVGAQAAVLDGTDPGTKADLHRRAAAVLRKDGSPATAVAGHLLAASADGAPWSGGAADIEVLRDAAEDLLAQNDARQALRLLELAHEAGADSPLRSAIRIRRAQITTRYDPAAAERQVGALLDEMHSGRLGAEHVQQLAGLLLAQGRLPDAAHLLKGPEGTGADPGTSPLDTMLDTGVAASERLLQSARLTDATMAPLSQALRSLIASEHPERAVPWSRKLMEEANRCQAPGWSAVFTTLHAESLLRLGDLRGAHTHASLALELLPEKSGGTFHCAPTAVLIRACSGMGRYAEASRYADQQVPQRFLTSLYGLGYLRARGLHQLAVNQPHAALADFLEIGRILEGWGADRPAHLPWRTDAAEALLLLGKPRQAEQFVLQQLSLPDARRPSVRGVSLRLRALTGDPKQRMSTLSQSIDELHRSGDRMETARSMAELGRALEADGSPAKGSSMIRTAWNLAKECEAMTLCKEILPDAPLAAPARDRAPAGSGGLVGSVGSGGTSTETKLSSSEQRVATLAAQGLTNREISAKLYLTVSTVEQHLTRVYRKLQIRCRGDLPLDLELGSRVTV
ncbi:BREX system ATP-binding domain-containing protein [Streptomyces sp. NPDC002886]|uniref:helix-turn-helix transcriptional regulator n=1 Tax=Streptomyces sp. NPDC002886 TaxID=3364667 RepID=UPI0036887630